MTGKLITFEGIDGIGKTTQVELLGLRLREEGYAIVFTKELGASLGGDIIRELLFKFPSTNKMHPGQADCLYLYDHIGNVEGIIKPALEQGYIVISDRYADSQFAYAASSKRETTDATMFAYSQLYGIEPDITILMRTSSNFDDKKLWTLQRAMKRKNVDAKKQQGKTWGTDSKEQLIIQDAYIEQLCHLPRTYTMIIEEWEAEKAIAESIYQYVKMKLK